MATVLGANSVVDSGFKVTNSVRFNDGDSSKMLKASSSVGNGYKGTLSAWVKRSAGLGVDQQIIGQQDAGHARIIFNNDNRLRCYGNNAGENNAFDLASTALFRDVGAWYHIVFAWDNTQGTAANRNKVYVNGVQLTDFATETYNPQNAQIGGGFFLDNKNLHVSGKSDGFFDGYMAEVVGIEGTTYAPTDFGEFDDDSGIWIPLKSVADLTFGTNGFYLDFKVSGNLGNDANGGTDFTETNVAAIDQSTDTCTNNFATFNPLNALGGNIAYSEGNLVITPGTSDYKTCISSIAVDSGKWYAEFKAVSGHNGSTDVSVGIVGADDHIASTGSKAMSAYLSSFSYGSGGLVKKYNNSTIRTDATYTDDDIIGIAVDMDNLKLYWSKNGTYNNSGDPTSGATGTGAVAITPAQLYYIAVATISSGGVKVFAANFGSPPYSESGGNSDADGHGNFLTAPPSGYFALNTKNLAEYGG